MKINKTLLLKALGYKTLSVILTALIALTITKDFHVAIAVGLWDSLAKLCLYYGYEELINRFFYHKVKPSVIWMTGLSGAGKTTIAKEIEKQLTTTGNKVVLLDGDEIRNMFPSTGFDVESRMAHNKRVAYMASLLKEQGSTVIVSIISPMKESRIEARELCGDRFFEVYVNTSLELCEERDVKGLYKKVRSGEIKNFTGIDSPYDIPEFPDMNISTKDATIKESANRIIKTIRR